MTVNNLPAAAFGAVWLLGGSPDAVVAYLVGTNMLAIATPHGSLATILSRRLARRGGVHIKTREYLLGGWVYAAAAGVPAIGALLVARVPRTRATATVSSRKLTVRRPCR